jgi:hypothetical protein
MLFFMRERCAVAQTVSHRFPTVGAWVRSQVRSYGICDGQNDTGQVLSENFISPASFHSTDCSTVILIYQPGDLYSRPNSGEHTKWTQPDSTPTKFCL